MVHFAAGEGSRRRPGRGAQREEVGGAGRASNGIPPRDVAAAEEGRRRILGEHRRVEGGAAERDGHGNRGIRPLNRPADPGRGIPRLVNNDVDHSPQRRAPINHGRDRDGRRWRYRADGSIQTFAGITTIIDVAYVGGTEGISEDLTDSSGE